jgi:hypothetical protein
VSQSKPDVAFVSFSIMVRQGYWSGADEQKDKVMHGQ